MIESTQFTQKLNKPFKINYMKIWAILSVAFTIGGIVLYTHAAESLYTKIFWALLLINNFFILSKIIVIDEGDLNDEE